MFVLLWKAPRRPPIDSARTILTYITKSFLALLPRSALSHLRGVCGNIKFVNIYSEKREENSSEGKRNLFVAFTDFSSRFLWDPTRQRVCEKANKKKRGESPRALEKWQISLDSLARFRLHFKFNFNCTFSRIITNRNCFGTQREKCSKPTNYCQVRRQAGESLLTSLFIVLIFRHDEIYVF